ncbi:MAG TPA: hypothetical protein VFM93_08150 [Candidatus Limnocylindria bacterium]|nr:hypothetical protein [Candidatus Limnocylindria bacterium]
MTAVAGAINTLLGILFILLVIRLLVARWTRGGALIALALVFLYLLVAYGPVEAMIGGFLMLLAVPALGRSGLGPILMTPLRALTEPVIAAVRRGTGGRVGDAAAILIAIAAIWVVRFAFLLPALRG